MSKAPHQEPFDPLKIIGSLYPRKEAGMGPPREDERQEEARAQREQQYRDRGYYDNGHTAISVMEERLENFMRESEADRRMLHQEISTIREQTHDWMQAMLNRLPPWAVSIGAFMTTAIGAMAMWILTRGKG